MSRVQRCKGTVQLTTAKGEPEAGTLELGSKLQKASSGQERCCERRTFAWYYLETLGPGGLRAIRARRQRHSMGRRAQSPLLSNSLACIVTYAAIRIHVADQRVVPFRALQLSCATPAPSKLSTERLALAQGFRALTHAVEESETRAP